LAVLAVATALGCSSDGSERICDPGSTQTCVCGGGVEGGQTCSDDGTRWGECDCVVPDASTDVDAATDIGADTDGPADTDMAGDGEDGAGCEASCGPAGATACRDDDLQICQTGADGCLAWTVVQHCLDTGLICTEVGGTPGCNAPLGNCSLDGAPCITNADCPETTLEGFCFDLPSDSHGCIYDTWVATPDTETCAGHEMHVCQWDSDCPASSGMSCYPLEATLCGTAMTGICWWRGSGSCAGDSTCDLTGAQTCAICGNDTIESSNEECDDGNTTDGDGCSGTCRYERHCRSSAVMTDCGCMTVADCSHPCGTWDEWCTPSSPCGSCE